MEVQISTIVRCSAHVIANSVWSSTISKKKFVNSMEKIFASVDFVRLGVEKSFRMSKKNVAFFVDFRFQFREILGIERENVTDPLSDEFFNFVRRIAAKNTSIYEEVFRCLPSNKVRSFNRFGNYVEEPQLRNTDPEKVCV